MYSEGSSYRRPASRGGTRAGSGYLTRQGTTSVAPEEGVSRRLALALATEVPASQVDAVPQGLKPALFLYRNGTAEVVILRPRRR